MVSAIKPRWRLDGVPWSDPVEVRGDSMELHDTTLWRSIELMGIRGDLLKFQLPWLSMEPESFHGCRWKLTFHVASMDLHEPRGPSQGRSLELYGAPTKDQYGRTPRKGLLGPQLVPWGFHGVPWSSMGARWGLREPH